MFDHLTESTRSAVLAAGDAARALGHSYVGTEHLLLGLLTDGGGTAARALAAADVTAEAVRDQIERLVGLGSEREPGERPFTPRATSAFDHAQQEANRRRRGGGGPVSPEHLLLGLLRVPEGVAMLVLVRLGVEAEEIRALVRGDR